MPIKFNELLLKIVAIPAAAYTAGTSFTVAHGLGFKPNVNAIQTQETTGTASLTDDVQSFGVQSADTTNVTLKPSRTATSQGTMYIWLDKDSGARNQAGA